VWQYVHRRDLDLLNDKVLLDSLGTLSGSNGTNLDAALHGDCRQPSPFVGNRRQPSIDSMTHTDI
jgi:hypothetical protein